MSNCPGSNSKLGFRIDWIFPSLRKPVLFWNIASSLTVAAVGLFSKLVIGKLLLKYSIFKIGGESPRIIKC